MADLGEGPGGGAAPALLLFWVKKEEITEGRKARRASKLKLGLLLSLNSGSATAIDIVSLKVDESVLMDDSSIAHKFNSYFSSLSQYHRR